MKVFFTRQAERNLEEIADWIAQNNPDAAERLIAALRSKALALGSMPRAFPVVDLGPGGEYRRRIHRRYLILYRVSERVEIIGFVHAARDYLDLFRMP
ncbi:type II toxin-antitoxin system RelE/ParE family toxin [Sphingomonas bacterium]|uniref:type II toxin-antitoxin system RelE/ParE family toxin n=1 Tax=Sphingomonas bacterium TaxID=1895847 RepID=UPI001576FAD0|nr:type II toxin-antitoxin system RelE/ParE family toxin [Sphingomonas bacterium]